MAQLEQLRSRHARLVERAQKIDKAYGLSLGGAIAPPSESSPDQLGRRLDADEARLAEAERIEQNRTLAAKAATESTKRAREVAAQAAAAGAAHEVGDDESWRASAAADIKRHLERLMADANDEDDAERVAEAARRVARAGSRQSAHVAVSALGLAVQEANDRIRERHDMQAQLDSLLLELAGLDHPLVDAARQAIERVGGEAGPVSEGLKRIVAEAREAAELDADRAFAISVVQECLEDLGYQPGEQFVTELADSGKSDVPYNRQRGYGVRVWAPTGTPRVTLRLVRGDSSRRGQDEQDIAVAGAFCEDHAALIERSRDKGLELTIERADPADTDAVQEVDDFAFQAPAETPLRGRPLEREIRPRSRGR